MQERQIKVPTKAGKMNTLVCHPERHGPHPVILFFMDAPGIREELREMARRLATVGYYVMLPNLYYRSNAEEIAGFGVAGNTTARGEINTLMNSINIPMVTDDAEALLAFAATDPEASKGPVGCVGYCMSGQYAVNTAVRFPDRVRAVASIYGVKLVTDQPDSPHLAPPQSPARFYFACAEHDEYAPMAMVERLQEELGKTKANAEVEIYAGVHHGFAFPKRPAYDRVAADRHWERLVQLFGQELAQQNV